jgi:cysteine desulfuration protein SufE
MPPLDPLDDLRGLPDAAERLMWLVERGRHAPVLEPAERVLANRVEGCVSAVWLVGETRDGVCTFRGDAEAPVLRGIVALICTRASGKMAAAVAADTTDVVTALELERHLTPTRVRGLRALQTQVRRIAAQQSAAPDS